LANPCCALLLRLRPWLLLLLLGIRARYEKRWSSWGVCAAWEACLTSAVLMLLPLVRCCLVPVQQPQRLLGAAAAAPCLAWTALAAAAAGLPAVLLLQLLHQLLR
jgi:hypothetical protein